MVGSEMNSLCGTGSDSSPPSASVCFFEVLGLAVLSKKKPALDRFFVRVVVVS